MNNLPYASLNFQQAQEHNIKTLSKEALAVINFLDVTAITSSKIDRLQRIKFAVNLCSHLQDKSESKVIHHLYIVAEWNSVSGKN